MPIPKETIELVRERAHIHDIIKRYVPSLKKNGNNYIALCPFHKEKTPSFVVSPEKQIFNCFGCHAGGNVFSFISKVEGLNFPESVRFIGDIVGIKVENISNGKNDDKLDKLAEINRITMDLFHNALFSESGKAGLNYLKKRGVTEESIKEFKLGYAPDSWDFLVNNLRQKNISITMPCDIGLVSSKDKKKFFDRFRNRVMFPIVSHRNDVVAFGGRIIGDAGEPKYLNSPESVIYKKRKILYGLNIAKKHISEYKRAIIVEGYLDVIGCHQCGLKNVIAPLGTALTDDQVQLLTRFCNEVILLFDSDSAGIKASLRSIEVFQNVNVDIKIAVLPEGDPFDFIIDKGPRELMIIIDSAVNPIDFQIQNAINKKEKDKDNLNVLLNIFDIINKIEYETKKDEYLKKVSTILGIQENTVRLDYNKYIKKESYSRNIKLFHEPNSENFDFLTKSYRELVHLLCCFPELLEQAVIDFSENEFTDSVSKNVFIKLSDVFSKNENITIDKVYDYFPEGDEKYFLEKNQCSIEDSESAYNDYNKRYIRIKFEHINQKINQYENFINDSGNLNSKEINDYLIEYQILQRERDKLSSYL